MKLKEAICSIGARVLEKLTYGYTTVAKGVEDLMGGYIVHTRTDDILDLGREQGGMEREREIISDMLRRGKKPEEIADFCGFPIELVEEVEKALGAFRPGLTINGQYTFKIKDEDGSEKTIQLFDEIYSYKIKELALILNQLHQQIYGESYLLPINSQFERRVQNIEIEGVDEDLATTKDDTNKAHAHDHDHDEEEKADLKEQGVIDKVSISTDNILVPKLDVKYKK